MSFRYSGRIPASKSILNRLLVIQSFEPTLEIVGDSRADDVVKMKSALRSLNQNQVADCGAAGTTFRFLALRASRCPGRHRLTGTARLLSRPQSEIEHVLAQLGCRLKIIEGGIEILSDGWTVPSSGLRIDRSISSQFASAVILSAWELPRALEIRFEGHAVSEGYLRMTLEIASRAGLAWRETPSGIVIPAGQRVTARKLEAESDLSSAFAVAALAAVDGRAEFEEWPAASLQPDAIFPELLERMGCGVQVHVQTNSRCLIIEKAARLKALEVDLRDSPDLFPVLSVLCALAEGESHLKGAPHLAHKESSRIEKSAELARRLGAQVEMHADGMKIHGTKPDGRDLGLFDPEHDHRMAMAAEVTRRAGYQVQILHPDVVDKSFPEFWEIAR